MEDVIEAVPSNWLKSDTECYWPPKELKQKISFLVIDRTAPDPQSWSLEPIEFLHDYSNVYIVSSSLFTLDGAQKIILTVFSRVFLHC